MKNLPQKIIQHRFPLALGHGSNIYGRKNMSKKIIVTKMVPNTICIGEFLFIYLFKFCDVATFVIIHNEI